MVTPILACIFSQLNFSGSLVTRSSPLVLNKADFASASMGCVGEGIVRFGRVQWSWEGIKRFGEYWGGYGGVGEGTVESGRE